jgi:hypothetical protein
MALPPLVRPLAELLLTKLCAKRSPADLREQVRTSGEITGNTITISEHRVVWDDPSSWTVLTVAVLTYDAPSALWTLYCFDRNSRRSPDLNAGPCADLVMLLDEVDRDPSGIFWG